ncbi:MAG: TrbG/VirB9 family P-type conjugative transfer protein [Sphingobacteriia bacterium]|nr:TrbG/VirB9 family P-type conjugative transfer protein [Sphingobacteriia bacterium]
MRYLTIIKNSIFAFIGLILATLNAEASYQTAKADSRIKTFVYDESDIYKIVVHKGFQTTIELARNEEIETISLGSPYAWTITPVGRRIFIKPHQENIHTNFSIITDKHTYNFEVLSKEPEYEIDDQLAYVVRFYYPDIDNKIKFSNED